MTLPSIAEIDIRERKVLIRVDFDVTVTRSGEIPDTRKLTHVLPTIRYAIGRKARVIIASHMSGAGGRVSRKHSLEPLGSKLSELLDCEIYFPENSIGDAVRKISGDMLPGSVMLLENLEFHKGELANSQDFARKLSEVAEVYVNEAFSVSHQRRASLLSIIDCFDTVCVGLKFREEMDSLGRFRNPDRPFAAVIGGSCTPGKIGLIESLIDRVDTILIGGALAHTFLRALGRDIGRSEIDEATIYSAKRLIASSMSRNIRLVIPEDFVAVRGDLNNEHASYIISGGRIPNDSMAVDIGPETIRQFAKHISRARTVLWNGPLGMCEMAGFGEGTRAVAKALAGSEAWSAAVGDSTIDAVEGGGIETGGCFLSRGGDASIEFIMNGTLPAIQALERRVR
jgi:phosphoglycerate kinase